MLLLTLLALLLTIIALNMNMYVSLLQQEMVANVM